jgi:uncharacterized protein (TIGR04255 family)
MLKKTVSFLKAPLVEVVMGIQFSEDIITNEFIYSFYNDVKNIFPSIEEHPPLPSKIENKDEPSCISAPIDFNARKFFISSNKQKLIQLQSNRILFNWRTTEGNDSYPHYVNVLKEFIEIINNIKKTILIIDKINQLEFTYVDHISPKEFNSNSYKTIDIFKTFNISEELKFINCSYSSWHQDINGNLIINLTSALRNRDQAKIFNLESTCRGSFGANQNIEEWMNSAHNILVNYFINNTTDNAKQIWKQQP